MVSLMGKIKLEHNFSSFDVPEKNKCLLNNISTDINMKDNYKNDNYVSEIILKRIIQNVVKNKIMK